MRFSTLFRLRRGGDDPAQNEIARLRDYQACFSTEVGARVLEDICRSGMLAVPLIGDGPPDPTLLAIREGRRSLALDIAKWADSELLAFRIEQREHQEPEEGVHL